MNKFTLVIGLVLVALSSTVSANGSVRVGVGFSYSSGGGYAPGGYAPGGYAPGGYAPGGYAPGYGDAPVTVWPNGRVTVHRPVVTHVYPRGESLIHQRGGTRVYSQGYGGPSTCYVDCWHNGVRPGGRGPRMGGGSRLNVNVGVGYRR